MKLLSKIFTYKNLAILSTIALIFLAGYTLNNKHNTSSQDSTISATQTGQLSPLLPSPTTQSGSAPSATANTPAVNSRSSSGSQTSSPTFTLPPPINTTPSCNQALYSAAISKRDAATAAENTQHANYNPPAPPDSSYWGNYMDQENARHKAALAQIDYTYQQDVAVSHC